MRTARVFIWAGILSVALAACGSGAAVNGAAGGAATLVSSRLSTSYSNALPLPAQLAVGTLKLAGSDQAVGAAQAAELLPLWQAYRSLLNTSTAAEAEYLGLQHQIESVMTTAQLDSIAKMRLTSSDLTSTLAQQSGSATLRSTPAARSTGGTASGGSASGGGTGPGGPPPGGDPNAGLLGGGPDGVGASSASTTSATPQATAAASGSQASEAVSPRLVGAVIQQLEGLVATTPPL